jgi:hypothetical protein
MEIGHVILMIEDHNVSILFHFNADDIIYIDNIVNIDNINQN